MFEEHIPTNCSPGSDEVRLFARLSLPGKVQRRHPKCVLQALNEASASVLGGFDHRLIGLYPQKTVPLLLLNAKSSNGRSSVIAGPLPGQDDKVFIDFVDLEVPRLTGWIWGKKKQKTVLIVPSMQGIDENVSSASNTHQTDVWRSSWLSRWAQRCQICSRHAPGNHILCRELA